VRATTPVNVAHLGAAGSPFQSRILQIFA
jgi:hypothetical protein